jgi:argininosuccinate synthase
LSGVIVLAYSGGLDTSVCIPLLRERYGFDRVITVLTDVGQPKGDIERGNKRAEKLSDEHHVIDAKEEFVSDYIFPAIMAYGSYEGYVLGTAIARPLIARKTVEMAERLGADALGHGCTGRGNDQLRFEAIFRATEMRVVAPMRDLDLSRAYGRSTTLGITGIDVPGDSGEARVHRREPWSRSIEGGLLEDPFFEPPEESLA